MPINFPSSPTNGQSYTSNNITFFYDSNVTAWLTTYVAPPNIDFTPANNWANTLSTTDRLIANNFANTKLANSTVTLAGDLTVSGNLIITSNTTLTRVNTVANNSFGTSGQVLTSNGSGNVYWSPRSGSLLSRNVYTSTQTITMPTGVTSADVTMVGAGGGGQGYIGGDCFTAGNGGGAGGALFKLLTGLTAGLTLSLTVGSGGGAGSNGSADTILASGTQSITTLTASKGITGAVDGAGGSGTNGDINISGRGGGIRISSQFGGPGGSPGFGLGIGAEVRSPSTSEVVATGYGAGGSGGADATTTGGSGTNGICIITWYR